MITAACDLNRDDAAKLLDPNDDIYSDKGRSRVAAFLEVAKVM